MTWSWNRLIWQFLGQGRMDDEQESERSFLRMLIVHEREKLDPVLLTWFYQTCKGLLFHESEVEAPGTC